MQTARLPQQQPGLPAEVSSLVGRGPEIAAVRDRLRGGRVVTLTGAGGCGKTRLALRVAALARGRLRGRRPAGRTGPAYRSGPGPGQRRAGPGRVRAGCADPGRRAGPRAGSRELLVVLDNCEHVLEAAADLVATLLAQCRRLRFLATSRERLDVPGELVFPVPPLGLPADGSAAAVAASEAGLLFAARAGAASPAFELSAHNSAAVAQMCARLDGILLAIELAAARCPALSPAELAARLDGHPGLLSGGPARPGQSPGVWWWRLPGSQDARSGSSRSGEPAACSALPWAVSALGRVPEHPAARLDWQRRAASIAAWRELSGYHHPADPIGPEPAAAAPDLRAAWHEALAALGPVGGPDVRGMPDGMLLHLRDTYPVETAWAPQYVGDELRQIRDAAWDARLTSLRAATDARAARRRGDHLQATQEQERARSYHALEAAYRQRETVFAAVMADRTEWDAATRQQRQLAVAADAEVRRRHPGQYFAPLRSAEPAPATGAQHAEFTLTAGEPSIEMGQWIKDLAAGRRTFADRLADRQSQTIPSEDPDYGDLGPAFPAWSGPPRGAILQPPKPEMTPSPQILQRAMDRDADWEAAD